MPLHITVKVNDHLIEDLHIGRIKGGTNPDDLNTYLVVAGDHPITLEGWKESGIEFTHRYGDNALVCLRKALEALELSKGEAHEF